MVKSPHQERKSSYTKCCTHAVSPTDVGAELGAFQGAERFDF